MCHGINGVSTALVKCVVLVNNKFPAFSGILSVRPFPWRCRLQGCLWCLRMSTGLGWAGEVPDRLDAICNKHLKSPLIIPNVPEYCGRVSVVLDIIGFII